MNCRSSRMRWQGSVGVRQASGDRHSQMGHGAFAFSGPWVIPGMMFGSPQNILNNHNNQHLFSEMC